VQRPLVPLEPSGHRLAREADDPVELALGVELGQLSTTRLLGHAR
jgi:hypothetical protein